MPPGAGSCCMPQLSARPAPHRLRRCPLIPAPTLPPGQVQDEVVQSVYRSWKAFQAAARDSEEADLPLERIVQRFAEERGLQGEALERLLFSVNTHVEHEYGGSIASLSLLHWDQVLPRYVYRTSPPHQ